ncbi:MAG: hypothetical protein JXR75_04385 [Rhodobacteraceae bacterium]|nr:hypothetical protein [Paracoccaceae bacterium]
MFGLFQRASNPTPDAEPAAAPLVATQESVSLDLLCQLLGHWETNGRFSGAIGNSLPQMTTEDGIEVICDPDRLIGITVAPTAFGIEVADMDVQQMTELVNTALARLPRPDWTSEAGAVQERMAVARMPWGPSLRLTCLPCPVDPCFNGQHHAGTRLIGHALPG